MKPSNQRPPTIDPQAVSRLKRLPPAPSPWLHEEVGRRMEERLGWIKLEPSGWVDWFGLVGGLITHQLIAKRYPQAMSWVVEESEKATTFARSFWSRPWWNLRYWLASKTKFSLPKEGGVEMVWANMVLHRTDDPQALIENWRGVLSVDGFVMFSCFGPDTFKELRQLYAEQNWPEPCHQFTDMHDWGDMLIQAGFAEPVMDMETITLTFESPQRLVEELRGLGRNLHTKRFSGLRGRRWLEKLYSNLAGKPLQVSFEIIYGHAFRPVPRSKIKNETTVSLSKMKEFLSQSKTYPTAD